MRIIVFKLHYILYTLYIIFIAIFIYNDMRIIVFKLHYILYILCIIFIAILIYNNVRVIVFYYIINNSTLYI